MYLSLPSRFVNRTTSIKFKNNFARNVYSPKSYGDKGWDVIVVGGGHNGLISASYLAKTGLSVLVLERRHLVGGAAVTEEIFPGYKFSRCSYLSGLLRPQIIQDLELKKHGLKFYPRNPSSFTPILNPKDPKASYLLLGSDSAANKKEIAKFSQKDADAIEPYEQTLDKVSQFIEHFLDQEPPNIKGGLSMAPEKLRDTMDSVKFALSMAPKALKLGANTGDLLELLTAPATKILNRWFESEPLISTLATDSIIGALVSPSTPGSGYVLLHHVMGITEGHRGIWAYVEGGMGAVSKAIAESAKANGAKILLDSPVEQFLLNDKGAIEGVQLRTGEKLYARTVLSNATPHTTFLNLCPPGSLPKDFETRVRNIDVDTAVTKINVALSGLPNFTAYPNVGNQPGPQHRGTIHICKDVAEIEQSYLDALNGKPSERPIIEMTIPSSLDPTLAPPGHHVASLFVQYTPYHLKNGKSWEDPKTKEEFADRVFSVIDEYAPGFSKLVIGRDVLSPLDLEKIFGLTGGNIFHGSMGLNQLFWSRPVPGYANYRTPIKGLYLCGSGGHPGGGVMGAAGRNAAFRVLKDLKNK